MFSKFKSKLNAFRAAASKGYRTARSAFETAIHDPSNPDNFDLKMKQAVIFHTLQKKDFLTTPNASEIGIFLKENEHLVKNNFNDVFFIMLCDTEKDTHGGFAHKTVPLRFAARKRFQDIAAGKVPDEEIEQDFANYQSLISPPEPENSAEAEPSM